MYNDEYINDKFGKLNCEFTYKGQCDFNQITQSGMYGVYGICKNSYQYGIPISVLTVKRYTADWIIQEIEIVDDPPEVYRRVFTGGTTWSNWRKM